MNKIAEDITVFVLHYFSNQRPFEILDGRMVKRPLFPNEVKAKPHAGHTYPLKSRLILAGDYSAKGLFVDGRGFQGMGIYYGDVYEVPEKPFYLFKVVREPVKTLILPDPTTGLTHNIKLIIQSPGGKTSNVQVSRTGTWQGDIEVTKQEITRLMGILPTLRDQASPNLETYIRAYYAMKKISSVGGDLKQGNWKILNKKP